MARTHNPDALPPKPFANCPVSEGEAIETDQCYQVLMERDREREVKYHRVIVLNYLTTFGYRERAAHMQPPGHFNTFTRRLNRAHAEILCILDDMMSGEIHCPPRGLSQRRAAPVRMAADKQLTSMVREV